MTELGEKSALAKPVKGAKKGKVKVSVRDICTGARIEKATVVIDGKSKRTDTSGEVTFSELTLGVVDVKVNKHFKNADYATFIVHYPKILRSYEAKSVSTDLIDIKPDKENKLRVEIEVYKLAGEIVFHRRHIDINGSDKYGHWWTVVDDSTSFGWWPKYPLGSDQNRFSEPPEPPDALPADAGRMKKIQHMFSSVIHSVHMKMYNIKESSIARTFRGVEGELNGVTSFKGKNRLGHYEDPHAGGGDEGDEQYQPVRKNCFDLSSIKDCLINFSLTYNGGWSWRLEAGNHCHTFQKKQMVHCSLEKVKVLK